MHLVRELGFATVDYSCIRVGAGNVAAVLFFVVTGGVSAFIAFFQARFQFFVILVQLMLQAFSVDYGVVGGIGINQAGIDKDLAAVNQPGLDTLQDNPFEEALKDGSAPFLFGFG